MHPKFLPSALLTLAATVPAAGLFAQAKPIPVRNFPFTPVSVQLGEIRLQHDMAALKEISTLSEVVLTGVPDASGRPLTLDLHRAAVYFEPGSIRVDGVKQPDAMVPGMSLWAGSVRGVGGSDVYLALSPFGTRGWIQAGGETHHLMARPNGTDWSDPSLVIMSESTIQAMGEAPSFQCEAGLAPGQAPVVPTNPTTQNFGGPSPNYYAPIAFETTYEYYTLFNNLGAAQTYAQALIGAISNQYDTQIGTIFQIPYLGLYTSNTDPWTPAACGTMLDQFRTAWDNGAAPVHAELYHLMTGSNCGGGVAYVNVLCNQNFGFGMSGNLTGQTTIPPVQGPLTWDFVVIAHEIGHNFNAIHTHSYNPPIDGCGNGDCSQAASGTIMSYCHLCPGGMSNINLVFHAQSAADMRTAVVNSCFQTTGGPNDECAGAVALSNGVNGPYDTTGATTSAPAWPCALGGNDRWYSYTATCTGDVSIDTCGSAYDTAIEAFSGSCNSLSSITCNDDSCSLQSRVTFPVVLGTTYYLRVGGFNGRTGTFSLNVACTAVVGNDECVTATPIVTGTNGPYDNTPATTSPEGFNCGFNVGNDLWFSYTSPADCPITVSTCTATRTSDTVLRVWSGACGSLTSINCNDDTCGLGSQVSFAGTTGTTYFIQVGAYNGRIGLFDVVVTATNDECSGAFQLQHGTNGPFNNSKATASPELFPCGFNVGHDLWFTYTSQGCGDVTFHTCTPARSVDTVMEVFTGTCATPTQVACNDDASGCGLGSRVTAFAGASGTTFRVHVGGYNGSVGAFEIVVTEGSGLGNFTSFPTGCGGLSLSNTGGLPVLGSSVGWQLSGVTNAPSILIGFVPLNLPICPACTLGATIDGVISGSSIPSNPIPCDPLLIGGQAYIQGVDLFSAGGCAQPVPLRLSNTIRITIG